MIKEREITHSRRLGNRTLFKRLGYLLEALSAATPALTKACREEMSAGISVLDPSLPKKGRIVKRWNLRVNATLAEIGAES